MDALYTKNRNSVYIFDRGNCTTRVYTHLVPKGNYDVYVLGCLSESRARFQILSDCGTSLLDIALPKMFQESRHNVVFERNMYITLQLTDTVERVVLREKYTLDPKPRILTIIPLYNCELYIERSIKSLHIQTVTPSLICVIDDNSTDSSLDVLDAIACDIPILIKRNRISLGPYVCKNFGLLELKDHFDFVTFLDSDDFLLHENYESLLEVLRSEEYAKGVYPHAYRMRNSETLKHPPHPQTEELSRATFAGLFARPELFDEVGYYDCVRYGADGEFHCRVENLLGHTALADSGIVTYRAEARSVSLTAMYPAPIDENQSMCATRTAYAACFSETKNVKPPINIPLSAPSEMRVFIYVSVMQLTTDAKRLAYVLENFKDFSRSGGVARVLLNIEMFEDSSMDIYALTSMVWSILQLADTENTVPNSTFRGLFRELTWDKP